MVITTIKHTGLNEYAIYNAQNELIATSKKENDEYLIFIYGGKAHGKIARANGWQDLNDKSVEIARL